METNELIRELRDIARIGIVNARRDTEIINRAADMIEAQDERISIMRESMKVMERQLGGKRSQILAIDERTADEDDRKSSGLIEKE